MAEPTHKVSIKQRIGRVIIATLAAQVSGSRVEPWHDRNSFDDAPQDGDILVVTMDESVDLADGNIGYTNKLLPVQAICLVIIPEDYTPEQAATYRDRRMAELEKAVMSNRRMMETQLEGSPKQLAVDTRITGTIGPVAEDGSPTSSVGIEFEVHYMHDADNPNKLGNAIPEKSE
jgi:hypothetical protein